MTILVQHLRELSWQIPSAAAEGAHEPPPDPLAPLFGKRQHLPSHRLVLHLDPDGSTGHAAALCTIDTNARRF